MPEAMRNAVAGVGRMVVSLAAGRPTELAGLRPGDIMLSVDGHSISGTHALRAFLGPEQVGRQVDVRLLRDGQMETRELTIAPQPAGRANGVNARRTLRSRRLRPGPVRHNFRTGAARPAGA
jgi:S1-C subfamily serine protease